MEKTKIYIYIYELVDWLTYVEHVALDTLQYVYSRVRMDEYHLPYPNYTTMVLEAHGIPVTDVDSRIYIF